MGKKKRVLILFGGRSGEHEVSLQSGRNVFQALDTDLFEPILVGITPEGLWKRYSSSQEFLLNPDDPEKISLAPGGDQVLLRFEPGTGAVLQSLESADRQVIDVVFPALHGTYGEDGTLQGMLEMLDVACVGPGVLSSSVCMDKDITRCLLRDAGVPVARGVSVPVAGREGLSYRSLVEELGSSILFVKPAVTGSSVGISRVTCEEEFSAAVDLAFQFDRRIVIEGQVVGRELECAVLGNDELRASEIGEIIPTAEHGFYSYDAKYVDPDGAALVAPAELSAAERQKVQDFAVNAFRVLRCEGLGRVDMFYTPEGTLYLNEINTIPGFTRISMYPRLWKLSGLEYKDLITELIQLALDRYQKTRALRTHHFEH